MPDINLKTATPDTTLPTTGFLFGADSQAAASPSVYTTQAVATVLLGSSTLNGATVTTSSPVIDAAQTWNAGGVTFTGLKFNATDTASAAASLLMDLQVGGASRFSVNKAGGANFISGNVQAPSGSTYAGLYFVKSGQTNSVAGFFFDGAPVTPIIGFGPGNTGFDLYLRRRGAANLALGAADAAAPVAQTLSVQSVVAGTTNTAGANLTITGSQGTGTGAGGSIIFQVAPAGSSGTAQNALFDAFTISNGAAAGRTLLTVPTFSSMEIGVNGAFAFLAAGSAAFSFTYGSSNFITVRSSGGFGWSNSATNASSTIDLYLYRDAANTLALRNGANAQAFRVYNTFTDASNYERGFMRWSSNVFQIGTEAGGTGSNRSVSIVSSDTCQIGAGGSALYAFTTAAFRPLTTNTYDIGTSTFTWRDLNLGRNIIQAGAYHEMAEMTAPAAPAANGVRIYAVDNGSGKTQLMALFATGAAQQIAIEP